MTLTSRELVVVFSRQSSTRVLWSSYPAVFGLAWVFRFSSNNFQQYQLWFLFLSDFWIPWGALNLLNMGTISTNAMWKANFIMEVWRLVFDLVIKPDSQSYWWVMRKSKQLLKALRHYFFFHSLYASYLHIFKLIEIGPAYLQAHFSHFFIIHPK